ncbi:unnamed protein product, partial [Heterosigma akashiwo]
FFLKNGRTSFDEETSSQSQNTAIYQMNVRLFVLALIGVLAFGSTENLEEVAIDADGSHHHHHHHGQAPAPKLTEPPAAEGNCKLMADDDLVYSQDNAPDSISDMLMIITREMNK